MDRCNITHVWCTRARNFEPSRAGCGERGFARWGLGYLSITAALPAGVAFSERKTMAAPSGSRRGVTAAQSPATLGADQSRSPGASKYLADLPSRGLFSSTVISSNLVLSAPVTYPPRFDFFPEVKSFNLVLMLGF